MEDIFAQWNLVELIPIFQENEINLDLFLNLTSEEIKELIPKVGVRKTFLEKYNTYLTEEALQRNVLFAVNTEEHDDQSTGSVASTSTVSDVSSLEDDLPSNRTFAYPQRATLGLPYQLSSHQNSVRKLIDTTVDGKLISASYTSGKQFMRSKLCELILKEELKNNPSKKISSSRFTELADEINQVFLHEAPELYYVPYVKNPEGAPKAARGKLYSTYIYLRKNLKALGLIIKSSAGPSSGNDTEDRINENEDVQWLKNNAAPFTEVREKWSQTTHLRVNNFPPSILEYVQMYPALSHPQGYTLFEIDFANLHPNKVNCLFSKWVQVAPKILKIFENRNDAYVNRVLSEYAALERNNSYDELFVLLNLPLLFHCNNIKTKRGGYKPSRIEQKEAFILHVKDINDLEDALERRREKYASFNLTCQPLPVIVGELNDIQLSTFVVCENIKYKVETPLKAVDVCFKLYHALNAEYPKEVDSVWMFIQNYIYDLKTEFDRKYVAVSTLISDIERQNA